jgi:hypothetical protein
MAVFYEEVMVPFPSKNIFMIWVVGRGGGIREKWERGRRDDSDSEVD